MQDLTAISNKRVTLIRLSGSVCEDVFSPGKTCFHMSIFTRQGQSLNPVLPEPISVSEKVCGCTLKICFSFRPVTPAAPKINMCLDGGLIDIAVFQTQNVRGHF